MIRGLEETFRYPRVGKLRIGMRDEARGFPISLDHFIVDAPNAPQVRAIYGEKPATLLVYAPGPLSEAVWSSYFKLYTKAGLACRGDGEVGRYYENGELHDRPCANHACPFSLPTEVGGKEKPAACTPKGLLSVKIVDVPTVGTYQVGINGSVGIARASAFLGQLDKAAGTIEGVPFHLHVVVEKRGGRQFSRVYLEETRETHEVLGGTAPRLSGEAPRVSRELTIQNEAGEPIANLSVEPTDPIDERHELALLIDEALRDGIFVGKHRDACVTLLRSMNTMTEADAASKRSGLTDYVEHYRETKDERVEKHSGDQHAAAAAWSALDDAMKAELGIAELMSWKELTRHQVRSLTQHLASVAGGEIPASPS